MDYTQFLYMHEELALLAVIVIMFIYDLVACSDRKGGKPVLNTAVPVVLMAVLTVVNAVPCGGAAEAFGGMYQYTPMMTIMKTVLNIGTLIVFLIASRRESCETGRILHPHPFHIARYVSHDFRRTFHYVLYWFGTCFRAHDGSCGFRQMAFHFCRGRCKIHTRGIVLKFSFALWHIYDIRCHRYNVFQRPCRKA